MSSRHPKAKSIGDAQIVRRASVDALVKLHPRTMAKNPVMFVVEVGSVLTTLTLLRDAVAGRGGGNLRAGRVSRQPGVRWAADHRFAAGDPGAGWGDGGGRAIFLALAAGQDERRDGQDWDGAEGAMHGRPRP